MYFPSCELQWASPESGDTRVLYANKTQRKFSERILPIASTFAYFKNGIGVLINICLNISVKPLHVEVMFPHACVCLLGLPVHFSFLACCFFSGLVFVCLCIDSYLTSRENLMSS